MKSSTYFLLFILFLATPLTTSAQSEKTANTLALNEGNTSPAAEIHQIDWIAGHWKGEAFGGHVEEVWSKPAGGAMMGMFRLVQGDEVGFYELLTLLEEDGSLVFRLKHFNSDLTGWEEKNENVNLG